MKTLFFSLLALAVADTAPGAVAPPSFQWVVDWIDRLGFPVAVIVLGWITLLKMFKWLEPRADKLLEAHIDRQKRMAQASEDMAKQTVEIQKSNALTLSRLELTQPMICKYISPQK